MATKVLFRKRKFLNRMGHHSGAFIFAEILRESWTHRDKKTKKKSTHSHRDITLSIADCSRIINLDFDLGCLLEAKNGLKKLDILIDTLKKFKEAYTQEMTVVRNEKRKRK